MLETAKDQPHSADVVHVVASRLMNASQFDLALQFLQANQPRHPGDFWINQYLAMVYFHHPERQLEESVRFFIVALALQETAAGYFNLGVALKSLERHAEAAQAFRAALRLQPDYVQAYLDLADVLERQSQTAEAAALRERAAQLQEAEKKRTDHTRPVRGVPAMAPRAQGSGTGDQP